MSSKIIESTRKRSRSDDPYYLPQKKCFLSEKIINSQNDEKMRQICNKTVSNLFNAMKNLNHENNNTTNLNVPISEEISLCGDGNIIFKGAEKSEKFLKTPTKSPCCQKASLVSAECRNCNLKLCEFCGYSCINCSRLLCHSCVSIFACGSPEFPCCDPCKIYVN